MKLKKYFRKTSINKKYIEFCRLTQKYPIMASTQLRWYWYREIMPDRFRHLGWYCNFAKKYGLYVDVKA